MKYSQYFKNYFEDPEEIESYHSIHKKKLTAEEDAQIQEEINQLFEKQTNSLSANKQAIYNSIKNMNYGYRKKFICSSWVRGFCFFETKECLHAHGIDDLDYKKDDDPSINAQTFYERIYMKNLTNTLNYIHLYQFCRYYDLPCKKNFTFEQINNDRTVRTTIREYTRTKMFEDFYLMIRRIYPDIFLTDNFLLEEFTRVGVGSDAFGFTIKASRIAQYLMKHLCYITKFEHPPSLGVNTNFMILRDRRLNIKDYLKEKVLEVLWELKKTEQPFIESRIRQLVKQSQQNMLEPCLEIYLVQDNMCLYRFFKNWATEDEEFFKQCTKIFEKTEESSEEILKSIKFDCCSDNSEKIIRKNKLIEEYLQQNYKNQKKKYCRYWLRGLCIFTKDQCQYSHGTEDLIYQAYDEHVDDPDYIDFMSQKPLWKERSYVSLFREQETLVEKGIIDQVSSQEELDNNKDLRETIREKMQQNTMEEFIEVIWKHYGKEIVMTESFIVREFTRVGFFKLGYTLKNQMIIEILCRNKCFVSQSVQPPLVDKKTIVYSFPDYSKITNYFTPKVLRVFLDKKTEIEQQNENDEKENSKQDQKEENQLKNGDQDDLEKKFNGNEEDEEDENGKSEQNQQLEENEDYNDEPLFTINEFKIKKEFYKDLQSDIPPLHLILKYFNKQLGDLINDIFDGELFKSQLSTHIPEFNLKSLKNSLILDSDTEKIQNTTNKLIEKKNQKVIFNFYKFFFKIYAQYRMQIRATIGFTKFKDVYKQILKEKYNCDIYNLSSKTLVLQKKQLKNVIKNNIAKSKNKANNQKPDLQYRELILQEKYRFKKAITDLKERIIIVDNQESIESALAVLEQQSFIGVDLEGNLSPNGHIELIQISYYNYEQNHSIIYVFDFLVVEKQAELFIFAKSAIKQLMENKTITKILQGCNKDAIALSHLFNTQIISGIDTQLIHNFISQVKTLADNKANNKVIIDHRYYPCGLNYILQVYSAPNGLNPLKNKFQTIFADPKQAFYYMNTRPINEDFLIYSSKDVEDLIPVYFNILKLAFLNLKALYDGIDIQTASDLIVRVSEVTCLYKKK